MLPTCRSFSLLPKEALDHNDEDDEQHKHKQNERQDEDGNCVIENSNGIIVSVKKMINKNKKSYLACHQCCWKIRPNLLNREGLLKENRTNYLKKIA